MGRQAYKAYSIHLQRKSVGHIVRKLDFAQANNKRAVDAGLLSLLSFTEYIHVVKHIRILYSKSLCLFLSQFKTNLVGNREERFCRDEVYVLTTSSQLQHQQIYMTNIYELKIYLRHVMRKPVFFCICGNKDADQLCGNRTADQPLSFRYIDMLPKSEI